MADDIVIGSCEASQVQFSVINVIQELSGQLFTITQSIGEFEMPLGTYVVDSCKKKHNQKTKDITGYDAMLKTDADVSTWYNSLTFPISVKNMRLSLLSHLDIDYEDQTITNDDVMLVKTVSPSVLVGRDVLKRLCEINAGFGHITRYNKFKVIQLSGLGLYPSETLYPSEDLFPAESGEYITSGYYKIDYEEYIVEAITSLTIRQEDEDVGTTVGEEGNAYIITGNYLLYGKGSIAMQAIANAILLQIKDKIYRPHSTIMMGLPYVEVGDTVTCITNDDAVESFVFNRTLSGIQALKDDISAPGNQKRSEAKSLGVDIQQMAGKALVIKKSVEELSINMIDIAEGLENQIDIKAGELQVQITNNKDNSDAQFTIQAGEINQRVEKDGVIGAINLSPELAKIQALNIELEGIVTANSNFKILLDGSIEAVNGKFKGSIESTSAKITGGSFKVTGNNQNDSVIELSYGSFSNTMTPAALAVKGSSNIQYSEMRPGEISVGDITSVSQSTVIKHNEIQTPACQVNGSTVITYATRNNYYYDSNHIQPIYTGSGNVGLNGVNVASVNWCNATFQPLSSSDFRLKYDFKSIEELPDELYLALKPWQYRFKTNAYGKGILFGLLAQQVESAFESFGFNALDYNIIEIIDKRDNTDEGQYVSDGKVHRINYENFHAWTLYMVQKMYKKVFEMQ
jgi:hypothetical protein